jgi:hypothetical protein
LLRLSWLQRVVAEETNAAVFYVPLQEIKVLQALISRQSRELLAAELELAGYEVNLTEAVPGQSLAAANFPTFPTHT